MHGSGDGKRVECSCISRADATRARESTSDEMTKLGPVRIEVGCGLINSGCFDPMSDSLSHLVCWRTDKDLCVLVAEPSNRVARTVVSSLVQSS